MFEDEEVWHWQWCGRDDNGKSVSDNYQGDGVRDNGDEYFCLLSILYVG